MSYFFFNDTATTEIYTYLHTLSRHDALPIYGPQHAPSHPWQQRQLPHRSRQPRRTCDNPASACRQNPTNLRQPVVGQPTEARRFGMDDNPSSDGRPNPTNLRQPVVQLTTETHEPATTRRRSEAHTYELQSLISISNAVSSLNKKTRKDT